MTIKSKESGSAKRLARDLLTNLTSEDLLRKLQPPARALIEGKIARIDERVDDAYLLLKAIVALQVTTVGLLVWLIL